MRFGAPRSYSPSPTRDYPRRHATAFGLHSDSDSEEYNSELEELSFEGEYNDNDDMVSIAESRSSSEISLVMDVNKLSLRPKHPQRTPLEDRNMEETIAAIRLRTRHHDPYEEWEKQTRKDAFKTARVEFTTAQTRQREETYRQRMEEERRADEQHTRQAAAIQKRLEEFMEKLKEGEEKMKADWKERDRKLWERIEAVIKMEEDKVKKKIEEEQRAREEEERKRREAELKRRLEEEKRLKEEEEKRKAEDEAKRLAAEKVKAEKEEEEKQKQLELERAKRVEEELELRKRLAYVPAGDEWKAARKDLLDLKAGPVNYVKSDKERKARWGKMRRQIVPKIGQLTNDPAEIGRITNQLISLLRPPPPSPPLEPGLYLALCYSLAKAILLQAEIEVTAEKRSAIPLAQVTFNLLQNLEEFPQIFLAKLVQRCGGWAMSFYVPTSQDPLTQQPWKSEAEMLKAMGYRRAANPPPDKPDALETADEHSQRVSAIMRVYFLILKLVPNVEPKHEMLKLPRAWAWFARLTGERRLLREGVAPQLIYTALDVLGQDLVAIYGRQWIKMLALLYEGITVGYEPGKLIGGTSVGANASRTRALLAIERTMGTL